MSVSNASNPPTLTQLIIYLEFLIEFFLEVSIDNLVGKLFAEISLLINWATINKFFLEIS